MDRLVEKLLAEFARPGTPAEDIDRALFRLRHEALYVSDSYREHRDIRPEDPNGQGAEVMAAKTRRAREAEILKLAAGDAERLFREARARVVARELAAERLTEWQMNRIPGVA